MAYFPKRSLNTKGLAPQHGFTDRPRDYFYWLMNVELFPEVLPVARGIAKFFLQEAEEYMARDQPGTELPEHYTFFEYDPDRFSDRMHQIYRQLLDIRYLSWLKAGEADTWFTKSKARLLYFILHGAPFHLTDGGWLRGSIPIGPIDEVTNCLASIWADELGNGKFEENHCNVYQDILSSHGYSIPPVDSKEFSEMQLLCEESFIPPVFHLAISLYGRTYYPEVLGMTLFLEWTSPTYHQAKVKLWERHNINPTFSKLHTAIDNVGNGHGKSALDAVTSFMDTVEKSQGKEAAKATWRRIWCGYVAYGISSTFMEVHEHVWEHLKLEPELESDVLAVFRARTKDPRKQLADVDIDGKSLNEWMCVPEEFVRHLKHSLLVKPGNAKNSPLLQSVLPRALFSADDVNTIATWINCLPRNLFAELSAIIQKKAPAGKHVHRSVSVTGNDGQLRPFNSLWDKPLDMLNALVQNGFVDVASEDFVRGDVDQCRLITSMRYGAMAGKFTWEEINLFREWIRQGCRLSTTGIE